MTMEDIRLEIAGKVLVVTLDRPPVNTLLLETYQALADTFDAIGMRRDVNCVVFTAAGMKAFCAGLDLREFASARLEDDPRRAAIVRHCFSAIRHCALPVIAAVNGPALGAGCVLTSVCDIRIAARNATFGLPEINVGRCGGTAHMGRHLPQGLLRRMFFTGRPIDAIDAQRFGYVDQVVSSEELLPTAMELAGIIADKAPLGLRFGKAALNEIEYLPVEEGYAAEQRYSTRLMATDDAREATRAVLEKRKPVWAGR
ncbi:MAG: enoyl-CoA hydratase-related protein [Beijerinckiaceae bacterium]|nr:enoyl-CoA hydratase-related protein [Beijerinckiaceae bacterium]